MRVWLLGVVIGLVVLSASLAIRSPSQTASEVERGTKGFRMVALTFDAGGEADGFPSLLQELAEADVNCTFFVTGRWAQKHPEFVEQLAAGGHEVGNHTWSHSDLTRLSDWGIADEITRTDKLLAALLHNRQARIFRAPFGSRDSRVLAVVATLGFQSVYWSLDSLDSVGQKKDPRFLIDRILNRKDSELDGAIILMHVGEYSTVEAVPEVVKALRARGFHFVTVSRIMKPSP